MQAVSRLLNLRVHRVGHICGCYFSIYHRRDNRTDIRTDTLCDCILMLFILRFYNACTAETWNCFERTPVRFDHRCLSAAGRNTFHSKYSHTCYTQVRRQWRDPWHHRCTSHLGTFVGEGSTWPYRTPVFSWTWPEVLDSSFERRDCWSQYSQDIHP